MVAAAITVADAAITAAATQEAVPQVTATSAEENVNSHQFILMRIFFATSLSVY